MEDVLHCNRLECRKNLGSEGQAVVTTCSHIFCLTCANKYFTETRSCPACEASLDQPDDVVVSFLNPSADYRTAMFQRLVLKNAQERATTLEAQLRTTISEANNQLAVLQTKVNDLTQEVKGEKRVSYELREKLRSASKDYERLKAQLDRNMRQSLIPGRTPGAMLSEAAANVIQQPKPVHATPARFYPSQTQMARNRTSPVAQGGGGSTANSGAANGSTVGGLAHAPASIWQAQAQAQTFSADGIHFAGPNTFTRSNSCRRSTPRSASGDHHAGAGDVIMHGRFDNRRTAVPVKRTPSRTPSRNTSHSNSDVLQSSRASNGPLVTPKTTRTTKPSLNEFFHLDR